MLGLCYILSTTSHAQGVMGGGGDSPPCQGLGQRLGEIFLVLNFRWVVHAYGFVHGFAHGFGVRWFLAPGIL